jgi:hypothetical protein
VEVEGSSSCICYEFYDTKFATSIIIHGVILSLISPLKPAKEKGSKGSRETLCVYYREDAEQLTGLKSDLPI